MDRIFPDEIFIEIFQYPNQLDLFRAFYNLNLRLNRIINKIGIYFHDQLKERDHQYILPFIHPKQIRSFHVNEEIFQYSKLHECVKLLELEFHSGSNNNVYTYVHPQLIHITPSIFPYLKKLTIHVQSGSSVYYRLCGMIFGNQFPFLESVYLPYVNGVYLFSIKTWSTSLKHVWINCCNKSAFYPLIENLPNIESFHCDFGTNNSGSMKKSNLSLKTLSLITYYTFPESNRSHKSTMSLDELIDVYKCLPNLEDTIVFLDVYSLEEMFDKLNCVLSKCSKLKTFQFLITYYVKNSKSFDDIKKHYPIFQNCTSGTWEDRDRYKCKIVRDDY